jgi:aminocarboxymuconate-semialdehyde decarboxylase
MTVIDAQTHWHPREYFEELAKRRDIPRCRKSASGEYYVQLSDGSEFHILPSLLDLDAQLDRATTAGVDMLVSSTGAFGVESLPADEAAAMAELLNSRSAEVQRLHENRIVATARIPMQDPDAAVEALNRAVDVHGLRAVCVASNLGGQTIAGPGQMDVYGEIARLGLPMFIHPTKTPMQSAWKRYGLEYIVGFMFDSAVAALDLVFLGVMDRHPTLKVVHPHLGAVLPFLQGRIDFEHRQSWALGKGLPQDPTAYLKRFWTDSVSQSAGSMRMALDFYGADRILFASDGPYWPVDDGVDFCRRTVPADRLDAVLGDNAAALLGLAPR